MSRIGQSLLWLATVVVLLHGSGVRAQEEIVVLGGEGRHCGEDAECFNRLHPAIPDGRQGQAGADDSVQGEERERLRPRPREHL